MTKFVLLHNLLTRPNVSESLAASFLANDGDEAFAMAKRWARYHSFDVDSVRVEVANEGNQNLQNDDFMEAFR